MVDAKKEVENLLDTIPGVSVYFYYPESFNPLPVISYYELSNKEGFKADNKEWGQESYIQIDIWAKYAKDTTEIGNKVNEIMQGAGWGRSMAMDLPSNDEINHRTMRFHKIIFF